VDANSTLEGATPPKKGKKKRSVPNDAQKKNSEDGKQPEGAIVVAQCTDGVAVAGMKHSFPLNGVCHSICDLPTKTSGEWTNSLKIHSVLSMETKDINAEFARLNVVVKGIKTKANKQEILRQANINKLPNKIAKEYKKYKNCVYDLLKLSPNGVTLCCTATRRMSPTTTTSGLIIRLVQKSARTLILIQKPPWITVLELCPSCWRSLLSILVLILTLVSAG
jgi:hypothetical protein